MYGKNSFKQFAIDDLMLRNIFLNIRNSEIQVIVDHSSQLTSGYLSEHKKCRLLHKHSEVTQLSRNLDAITKSFSKFSSKICRFLEKIATDLSAEANE